MFARLNTCLKFGAISLMFAALCAHAQDATRYPSKPVRFIVPASAGGPSDVIARLVAERLGQALGQTVVVENRPGAGGATGLIAVAKASPDGYTLGMGATGALTIGPHLPDAPPLNPQTQLQPLAKVADIPLVLVAGPASGLGSLQTLLSRARTADVPLANSGQYTAHHLSGELLAALTRTRLVAVPYRGSAPAVTDVLGGQVQAAIVDLTAAMPHIKAGTVKALAVTSARRTRLANDIPTMAEAGVPDYDAPAWMGLFLPRGVPPAVIDRLSREVQAILAKPEVQNQILALAAEPSALPPEGFAAFIDQESARWAKVIASLPKPTKP